MAALNHPFQPGVRVAVKIGDYDAQYREDFVLKIHKTGNFTLRSAPQQQWRAFTSYDDEWYAARTGDQRRDRTRIQIWDDSTDGAIRDSITAIARRKRFRAALDTLQHVRLDSPMTEEFVAAVEAAAIARAKP